MPLEKLFVYEGGADRLNNPVVDGAQLFSMVEFGRKDKETITAHHLLEKAFGKESF